MTLREQLDKDLGGNLQKFMVYTQMETDEFDALVMRDAMYVFGYTGARRNRLYTSAMNIPEHPARSRGCFDRFFLCSPGCPGPASVPTRTC